MHSKPSSISARLNWGLGAPRLVPTSEGCGTYDEGGLLIPDTDCGYQSQPPDADCGMVIQPGGGATVSSDEDCGQPQPGPGGGAYSSDACCSLVGWDPGGGVTYYHSDLECGLPTTGLPLTYTRDNACGLPASEGMVHSDKSCGLWNGVYYYEDNDCYLTGSDSSVPN